MAAAPAAADDDTPFAPSPAKRLRRPVAVDCGAAPASGAGDRCRLRAASRRLAPTGTTFPVVSRDAQERELVEFILGHVGSGTGAALYVAGAPGTGKSATVVG